MKIIRSIITILLTLSLCLCTFGAEAAAKSADKTAVSVSDRAKNIRVSDKIAEQSSPAILCSISMPFSQYIW